MLTNGFCIAQECAKRRSQRGQFYHDGSLLHVSASCAFAL